MANTLCHMDASVPGVEMTDGASLDVASAASLLASEPDEYMSGEQQTAADDINLYDFLPQYSPTFSQPGLTTHVPGETATHHNNNDGVHVPQFDPRALLNPKTGNPKRPASSGGDSDRGRSEPNNIGQVSLVERLHNVQERTASPAKRLKAGELQIGTPNRATFTGGSPLGLQSHTGSPAAASPQQKSAIDLTMSKYSASQTCKQG
jgi:hypothetical protein